MTDKRTIEKQIEDWRESVHDRIDNLCAIYKCADIKQAAGIIMAADSSIMVLFSMVHSIAEAHESEVSPALKDMVADTLTYIATNAVDLLCVDEDRKSDLIDDLILIVQTRYDLEERLNAE